jgi:hypothetical protein
MDIQQPTQNRKVNNMGPEYEDMIIQRGDIPREFTDRWEAMQHALDFAQEVEREGERVYVVWGGPSYPAYEKEATLLRSVGVKTLVLAGCELWQYDEEWSDIVNTAQRVTLDVMYAKHWLYYFPRTEKNDFYNSFDGDFKAFYDYSMDGYLKQIERGRRV